MPRMAFYIDYSTRIYRVYLKYVSAEDIHVYSIDEVFMDVTNYLETSFIRCTTSNRRARPPMPYAFSDGETAKQMVFSVRLSSATTRFVVSGSRPRSTHSTLA